MNKKESGKIGGLIGGAKLKQLSIEKYYKNPSVCLQCGKVIEIKEGQRIANIKHKRFCNSSCAAFYNNARRLKKSKICPVCKEKFYNKSKKQIYCSDECYRGQLKIISEKVISDWLVGKISGSEPNDPQALKNSIRNYLIEQENYKCSVCGWSEINPFNNKYPLEIDHIDGDSLNNRPKNLRVLCPNCHSLTQFHGILNKGRGRRKFRELYRAGK